jgi:hypothetical protein
MKRPRDDRRVSERLMTYLPEEFCGLGYIVFLANLASWLLVSSYPKRNRSNDKLHTFLILLLLGPASILAE